MTLPDDQDQASRQLIESMFAAALDAVEPARVVQETLQSIESPLVDPGGRIAVVAIGKAAERMAIGARDALGDAIAAGYVVTKDAHTSGVLDERFSIWEAAHPVPDERGVEATKATVEAVRQLNWRDTVLALISGGGSALFEAPRSPLELDDIAEVTRQLLLAGAPIQDLNAVRIPLSLVKGGGLRRQINAGRVITLILSDVLSNDPSFIASGPTIDVPHSSEMAMQLLVHYGVASTVPPVVIDALQAVESSSFIDSSNDLVMIVGDNRRAATAALAHATSLRRIGSEVWRQQEGEARQLGREWVHRLRDESSFDLLVGGGEATVTVRGKGQGGRNTEFALAAAHELDRLGIEDWTVASLATDGQDALTGAAGAIVDGHLVTRAREMGLDPEAALADNDSSTLLDALGALVVTGPTGTNVNDLYFAVRRRRR